MAGGRRESLSWRCPGVTTPSKLSSIAAMADGLGGSAAGGTRQGIQWQIWHRPLPPRMGVLLISLVPRRNSRAVGGKGGISPSRVWCALSLSLQRAFETNGARKRHRLSFFAVLVLCFHALFFVVFFAYDMKTMVTSKPCDLTPPPPSQQSLSHCVRRRAD